MRLAQIFLAAVCTIRAVAASSAPPNILMIAVDDLNNWITALVGRADTPNIARLASEGVLFRNAHCVTPACNPSRVALLTGLRPETTGQYSNDGNFRKLRPGNDQIVITHPQGGHAVALEQWQYIRYKDGAEELYDHATDPFEFNNLIGTVGARPVAGKLRAWLPHH